MASICCLCVCMTARMLHLLTVRLYTYGSELHLWMTLGDRGCRPYTGLGLYIGVIHEEHV